MPSFEKSPPELVARFNAILDEHAQPDVSRRPMFGYPCAWINGNMATGLFARQWWLRLADADREALLALPGAHPFEVMPGKAMGAYVTMPDDLVADDTRLGEWIDRSLAFTRTMPPKKK